MAASPYRGPDRRKRTPGSLGRRHADRKWPRHLRDLWLFLVSALVAFSLLDANHTIKRLERVGQAVCSLRDDLHGRVKSTRDFMRTHPNGIPGIPRATLQITLTNEQHTLDALKPLQC